MTTVALDAAPTPQRADRIDGPGSGQVAIVNGDITRLPEGLVDRLNAEPRPLLVTGTVAGQQADGTIHMRSAHGDIHVRTAAQVAAEGPIGVHIPAQDRIDPATLPSAPIAGLVLVPRTALAQQAAADGPGRDPDVSVRLSTVATSAKAEAAAPVAEQAATSAQPIESPETAPSRDVAVSQPATAPTPEAASAPNVVESAGTDAAPVRSAPDAEAGRYKQAANGAAPQPDAGRAQTRTADVPPGNIAEAGTDTPATASKPRELSAPTRSSGASGPAAGGIPEPVIAYVSLNAPAENATETAPSEGPRAAPTAAPPQPTPLPTPLPAPTAAPRPAPKTAQPATKVVSSEAAAKTQSPDSVSDASRDDGLATQAGDRNPSAPPPSPNSPNGDGQPAGPADISRTGAAQTAETAPPSPDAIADAPPLRSTAAAQNGNGIATSQPVTVTQQTAGSPPPIAAAKDTEQPASGAPRATNEPPPPPPGGEQTASDREPPVASVPAGSMPTDEKSAPTVATAETDPIARPPAQQPGGQQAQAVSVADQGPATPADRRTVAISPAIGEPPPAPSAEPPPDRAAEALPPRRAVADPVATVRTDERPRGSGDQELSPKRSISSPPSEPDLPLQPATRQADAPKALADRSATLSAEDATMETAGGTTVGGNGVGAGPAVMVDPPTAAAPSTSTNSGLVEAEPAAATAAREGARTAAAPSPAPQAREQPLEVKAPEPPRPTTPEATSITRRMDAAPAPTATAAEPPSATAVAGGLPVPRSGPEPNTTVPPPVPAEAPTRIVVGTPAPDNPMPPEVTDRDRPQGPPVSEPTRAAATEVLRSDAAPVKGQPAAASPPSETAPPATPPGGPQSVVSEASAPIVPMTGATSPTGMERPVSDIKASEAPPETGSRQPVSEPARLETAEATRPAAMSVGETSAPPPPTAPLARTEPLETPVPATVERLPVETGTPERPPEVGSQQTAAAPVRVEAVEIARPTAAPPPEPPIPAAASTPASNAPPPATSPPAESSPSQPATTGNRTVTADGPARPADPSAPPATSQKESAPGSLPATGDRAAAVLTSRLFAQQIGSATEPRQPEAGDNARTPAPAEDTAQAVPPLVSRPNKDDGAPANSRRTELQTSTAGPPPASEAADVGAATDTAPTQRSRDTAPGERAPPRAASPEAAPTRAEQRQVEARQPVNAPVPATARPAETEIREQPSVPRESAPPPASASRPDEPAVAAAVRDAPPTAPPPTASTTVQSPTPEAPSPPVPAVAQPSGGADAVPASPRQDAVAAGGPVTPPSDGARPTEPAKTTSYTAVRPEAGSTKVTFTSPEAGVTSRQPAAMTTPEPAQVPNPAVALRGDAEGARALPAGGAGPIPPDTAPPAGILPGLAPSRLFGLTSAIDAVPASRSARTADQENPAAPAAPKSSVAQTRIDPSIGMTRGLAPHLLAQSIEEAAPAAPRIEPPVAGASAAAATDLAPAGTSLRDAGTSSGAGGPTPKMAGLGAMASGQAATASVQAPIGGPASSLEGDAFPSLRESLTVLTTAAPTVARQALNTMPQPNAALSATLLLFLAAFRGGDIRGWMGDRTQRALEAAGRGELVGRVAAELGSARPTGEPPAGDWRPIMIPLYNDGELSAIRLSVPHRDDGGLQDGDDDGDGDQRFVIDLDLSRLGPTQLEGRLNAGRLSLVMRTRGPLEIGMRQEMAAILTTACEGIGLTGAMTFQTGTEHWIDVAAARRGQRNAVG